MAGAIVVETCVLNEPESRCCIPRSTCRDILLHGKFVSLAHIIQGKGMACKLRHYIGHAGSAVVFVLEALVDISQQSLGIIVLTLDGETKLACLHGATIQGLGNLDARKRHGAVVLVDKRYAALRVSLLGLQRTIVSVGHNNRYSFRAAVEGQAVRAVFGQRIAIPLGLIHIELVGTGLGKGDFAEAEAHWIIARGIRNRSRIGRNSYRTCLYRTLRSIVCSGKLEPKGFSIFHVTAGQSLGAFNCCRCGCGVIAICELEGSPLRSVTFQVLGTQHQHIIVVLKGYLDGPNRRVVPNACRIKVRVFKGILHGAPIAAIPDHFHDLVGERLFSLPLAQVAVSICCLRECNGTVRVHGNYRAAVGYTVMYARNLLIVIKLGQGCSWIIRASNYMEHTLLKGTRISRIGILLLSNGHPLNLLGVVFVHERRRGHRR